MFQRIKIYLILAAVIVVALVLVLNKFLAYGLIVFGVGAAAVAAYQLFLKQKEDEIHRLKAELKKTNRATEALQSENTELRNRKLNISEIKSVLDLSLMEVNTNFTRVWNEKSEYNKKSIRFLGALQVSIVAKYGLDLRDLRVKYNEENNEITVANINPKFISFSDLNYDWKIAEVLEYSTPLIGEKHWGTSKELESLNSEMKENFRKRIHEEVKNGPAEMEWVLAPLRKQVAGALEMIFDAKGSRIRIVEQFDESFKPYNELAEKEETV